MVNFISNNKANNYKDNKDLISLSHVLICLVAVLWALAPKPISLPFVFYTKTSFNNTKNKQT